MTGTGSADIVWCLTIELSGRTKPMSAVPDADHNLAATGTAHGPDAVRLNEGLGHVAWNVFDSRGARKGRYCLSHQNEERRGKDKECCGRKEVKAKVGPV